jgi:hypothetical protein
MHEQIDTIAYAHTSFFSTTVAEELADELIAHAPPGISHVYLVSGGSEAMEAALKLARQYFVEIGEPQRRHFIAQARDCQAYRLRRSAGLHVVKPIQPAPISGKGRTRARRFLQ